jgi:hypothetical protein
MSSGRRRISTVLGVFTLASLGPLLVWDAVPERFPARAHDVLGAVPLMVVAFAYVAHQGMWRVSAMEFAKVTLAAIAFLFWALNQLWPDPPRATLFNDIAITAFVLDVVLVIFGWPPAPKATGDGGDQAVAQKMRTVL